MITINIEYPFKPKTNKDLMSGQFWAIPLSSGNYACGRVIEIPSKKGIGSRTMFLGGLMDWQGSLPPVAEDLIGCRTLYQGAAGIITIHKTGLEGKISGYRSLELDGISPDYFRSQQFGGMLMRGLNELRPITKEEESKYEVYSTWGYTVIKNLAENFLVMKK